MKNKRSLFMLLMIILVAFLAGCATTGNKKFTKGSVDKIVEGKTTKQEVVKLLGQPDDIAYYDKKTVDEYIHRIFLKRPPEDKFPEDKYEFWRYWKFKDFPGLLPYTNRSVEESSTIILNSKGVIIKKIYRKKTEWRP